MQRSMAADNYPAVIQKDMVQLESVEPEDKSPGGVPVFFPSKTCSPSVFENNREALVARKI